MELVEMQWLCGRLRPHCALLCQPLLHRRLCGCSVEDTIRVRDWIAGIPEMKITVFVVSECFSICTDGLLCP